MTKTAKVRATSPHISIAANIPPNELRRGMLAEDIDNGFANRFLWRCSKRSKFLPEGGKKDLNNDRDFQLLQQQFKRINTDSLKGEATFDGDAQDIWGYNEKPEAGLYFRLAAERPGLLGQLTARAPQQVLRLSLIYALLDGALEIRARHLEAGLAVWRRCEDTCRYLFGESTADTILKALRADMQGMTRSDISRAFHNNKKAEEIQRALTMLRNLGWA